MAQVWDVEAAAKELREFADAWHYRSAAVEELEIDGDWYRRPLRPEDLDIIDFSVPAAADTVCDLPSLAAQRILRCLHDLQSARIPRPGDGAVFDRRAQFHGPAPRRAAARLAPFLEQFAFGFLDEASVAPAAVSVAGLHAAFGAFAEDARTHALSMQADFQRGAFASAELRFLALQVWCLQATKHADLAKAEACGYLDPLPPDQRPRVTTDFDGALRRLARVLDVDRAPHAFWQFYLPTTLAQANHLSALSGRPEQSLSLIGAAFVNELGSSLWAATLRQSAVTLGIEPAFGRLEDHLDTSIEFIATRFGHAAAAIQDAFGSLGLAELARGVRSAAQLAELGRRDIDAQLRWLSCIEDYRELAQRLEQRIRTQKPDIDRETFVEPREMCSTTHVHNDHRLVEIESGHMVFWARPGMLFRMVPGDRVLVPRGRLHGSSVESEQCVYHQPILPPEWVDPLVEEVEQRHGWRPEAAAGLARVA